jgi:hypothetical protein
MRHARVFLGGRSFSTFDALKVWLARAITHGELPALPSSDDAQEPFNLDTADVISVRGPSSGYNYPPPSW